MATKDPAIPAGSNNRWSKNGFNIIGEITIKLSGINLSIINRKPTRIFSPPTIGKIYPAWARVPINIPASSVIAGKVRNFKIHLVRRLKEKFRR